MLSALLLLAACDGYPRDSDGLTARAADAGMQVGASHDPPFVQVAADGTVSGPEVAVVQRYAQARGYRIVWAIGAHDALMAQLEDAKLHAVLGGHGPDTPWKPRVGWSHAFLLRGDGALAERRIALPPGQSAWQLDFDRHLIEHEGAR